MRSLPEEKSVLKACVSFPVFCRDTAKSWQNTVQINIKWSLLALREAKNSAYVLDQLKIQNDMTVEILEDSQEKTLIYSEILASLRTMAPKRLAMR